MKKIFASLFILTFAFANSFAQERAYVISDLDGNPYENHSVHVFDIHGSFEDPLEEAKLHFLITNTTSEDIYLRGQVIEMINTNGELAQFCIGGPSGNCFFPLFTDIYYPVTDGGVMYANSNWGLFDYFINLDPTDKAEYRLRFAQTDGAGNEIAGTEFFITYLYSEDGTMGVNDIRSSSIAQVYPTVAKNFTNVKLNEAAQVSIINLEGKTVKTLSLNKGESQVNLNGLSAGVYWVAFKGISGATTNIRIVVK